MPSRNSKKFFFSGLIAEPGARSLPYQACRGKLAAMTACRD
jgi:hypothetical protein